MRDLAADRRPAGAGRVAQVHQADRVVAAEQAARAGVLVLVEADTGVVDDDGGAVVGLVHGDGHLERAVRVVHRVGQQLGGDEQDRLRGTGGDADPAAQVVGRAVDAQLEVLHPRDGAHHQVHQVGVVTRQARGGAAGDAGDLHPADDQFVEHVEAEHFAQQRRVLVAAVTLLDAGEQVLGTQGLALHAGHGASDDGLGALVDALGLLADAAGERVEDGAVLPVDVRAGEGLVLHAGHDHVRGAQVGQQGGDALVDQMVGLGA